MENPRKCNSTWLTSILFPSKGEHTKRWWYIILYVDALYTTVIFDIYSWTIKYFCKYGWCHFKESFKTKSVIIVNICEPSFVIKIWKALSYICNKAITSESTCRIVHLIYFRNKITTKFSKISIFPKYRYVRPELSYIFQIKQMVWNQQDEFKWCK